MALSCFIPNCASGATETKKNLTLFSIIRTAELNRWWQRTEWPKECYGQSLPETIFVCEQHFDERDINRRHRTPRLLPGTLPSRNIQLLSRSKDNVPKVHKPKTRREKMFQNAYCRLCGAIQNSEMDDGSALLAILDDIFESKLALCDSQCLPVGVCSSCKESVKFVENFWTRCKEAQETLQSIYDKKHTVTENQQIGTRQTSKGNEEQEYLVSETEIPVENQQELNDHEESDILENSCNDTAQEDLNSEAGDELYGTNLSTIEMVPNMPDGSKNSRQHRKRNNDVIIESVTILEREPKTYGTLTKKTVPSYICHVCGKTFRSRGNLSNHKQIHSNELRFSCDACGKQFKMRRDLTMHIESIHERKLFKCNLCDVQFRWRKGLQRHVKVVHTRTAFKHDCQVCKKKFTTPGKLREHVMKHTGDRLWCEICGAGYRFNYMLTQHKIRKHSMTFAGVKLYEKKVSNYTKSAQRTRLQTVAKTCNIDELIMESDEGEEHLLEASVDYDEEILDSCDKTV